MWLNLPTVDCHFDYIIKLTPQKKKKKKKLRQVPSYKTILSKKIITYLKNWGPNALC